MNIKLLITFLIVTILGQFHANAQKQVTPPSNPRLPLTVVFQGESKFHSIVAKAEREKWRDLPLGERTIRIAREMVM